MVRRSQRDPLSKLSPEEAIELAARVAELTKAGLPLGPGLRALADELPGRRLPRVLRRLAERLDAGEELVAAIESQDASLPADLRGLVLAGVRSRRLAEVLEEYVDLQRSRLELRRRVGLSLAYPLFLLALMAVSAMVLQRFIIEDATAMYCDLEATLPAITQVTLTLWGPLAWSLVALLGLMAALTLFVGTAPEPSSIWVVLYRLPILGPLWRFAHLMQFARLMALLLEQEVPLAEALRLTAAVLPDARLGRACRHVADETEQGRALDQCMASRSVFPATLSWLIQWGRQTSALADALRAAGEMFEGRAHSQRTLLEAILLPVVFLVFVTAAGVFVIAMFLPMLSLIQKLT
jgi:type II secretory pathway component PulF